MRTILLSLVISLCAAPAFAEWTYRKNPVGPGYVVTDGKQTINVNQEKTAKKMAKEINKHEKKDKKGKQNK